MADQRISELFEITSSGTASNDELPIVDKSVSQTKKITVQGLAEAGFRVAADESLAASKLISSGITSAKIAAGAIGTAQLAATGVTGAKIASEAVGTEQLAASGVTTAKIADNAVTYAKLQNANANVILGRSSATGTIEELSCTAAGRALLDDADAAAQRTTLGLGNIALATGTWTNGASVSGNNTGDQTITLTGAIEGVGTTGIATTFATGAVSTAALADSGVTTAKIANAAVTGAKLAGDSSIIVATAQPAGGEFEGQGFYNSSTSYFSVWNGSNWAQIGGLTEVAVTTASGVNSPLSFTTSTIGNVETLTQDLNTQGFGKIFAGPISGADAKPTFRALDPADLPKATNSAVGAVVPGSGLTIAANGVIQHSNTATAGTYYKTTIDGNGHVVTGSIALEPSDIPNLDASKITAGTFSSAFIANDAIDGSKIADRVVCQFGESRPAQGDFVGQFFYDPINKDTYLWDSNVWQEVTVTAGAIVLAGLYSAATNQVTALTGAGAALSGVTVSGALPAASSGNSGYYFLVTASGTGTAPAPTVSLIPPDLVVSNGTAWYEVDISSSYVSQNAASISFTPSGQVGATNVQAAIEEVSSECRNASNITSGTLAIARGGTNLSSYTKGDVVYASDTNVLSPLSVGSLGQVLTVGSGSSLQWTTATNGTVTTVSGSSPLSVTNPTTTPILSIANASTSAVGAVQLTDSTNTTSSALAATATAVKSAYDLADAALPKAGGTMTGGLTLASGQSIAYQGQGYSATISAAVLTANRAITVPNASGTIVTTGASGVITNAMVASGAAIAGTKISANFGDQDGSFNYVTVGAGFPANRENTVVGSGALINYQTNFGIQNTVVGARALRISTGSTRCVAIGYEALSEGGFDYNVGVGAYALKSCTGDNNVGVGLAAGQNCFASNVAVGHSALSTASGSLTTGNTVVGQETASYLTQATDNTIIGYRSVYYAASGALAETTTLGAYALKDIGNNYNKNVAIGNKALYNLVSGSTNTAIGYSAGSNKGGGDNCVFIGNLASGSTSTVSNEITLGNSSITTLRCAVQTISALSDARDKDDVVTLPLGLNFINALEPVAFTWKSREGMARDGRRDCGFLAQDLLKAQQDHDAEEMLDLVLQNNPDRLEAAYGRLMPVVVQALKEASAEIDKLKQEVEQLKRS